jgi:NitT/TauT family transport system substrate-binding protein
MDIIFVHTNELAENPDKYVKFLRGIYRAVDYFYNNQEEAIPIIASHFSITPEEFGETLPNFRYTPYEEAVELMGSGDQEGRVYDVFRQTMKLNLDFGSADVELLPEDHITTSIIDQVNKDGE